MADTTYYFALKARDNVGNESALSNVASDNTATGVTIYSDDASSAGAWTLAGTPNPPLWHRTERRSNSPAHAWWYGREATGTYNTGAANWGTLTTSFDLTGYAEAALAFSEWSQVEATATFDRTRVQASTDGTTWITVFESHGTSGAWAQRVVDLTAYAGQQMQLRFYFETRDPVLNDFEGWYVDDVKVIGLPPTGFVADFTATATVGFAPLFVAFTDRSYATGQTITGWAWTFGVGAGSSLQNPEVTYAPAGFVHGHADGLRRKRRAGFGGKDRVYHGETDRASVLNRVCEYWQSREGSPHDTESSQLGRKRDCRRHRHDEPLPRHSPG